MKLKLPADEQDHLMRPAYITTNQFGTALCENRYAKSLLFFKRPDTPGMRYHLHNQGDGMRIALGRRSCCCRSTESNSLPTEKVALLF